MHGRVGKYCIFINQQYNNIDESTKTIRILIFRIHKKVFLYFEGLVVIDL